MNHKPLAYATINVRNLVSGKSVRSFLTDSSGLFSFSEPHSAIVISFVNIGYKTASRTITLDSLKNFGEAKLVILLAPDQKQLKEVTVTANKPLIRQEIDRLSYDVQADPDNKAQTVLEMMTKVPMLSLDGDENVKLKGSSNYRIFINGRPSSLLATNPKEALKAMPASSVQRIEVITTPPSKYDAEGLAGIINLVMRKQLVDGYNATVGANYNNTVGVGENATLTGKKGKLGVTGHAYIYQDFKRRLGFDNTRETLRPYISTLKQSGAYSYVGNYHNENLEVSYEADSLNLLTASVNFLRSRYVNQDILSATLLNGENQLQQAYHTVNDNMQLERAFDVDLNYQLGFAHHKDRLLTLSYLYHHTPDEQSNDVAVSQQYQSPLTSYRQSNQNATREQTFQLDYIQPGEKYTVDGGVKAILRRNSSDYTSLMVDPVSDTYVLAPNLNNQFDYHQDVYSLYHSWYVRLKTMEIKAGLRLEHTEVNAEFAEGNPLHAGYTNLIPVVSLQRKLKNGALNLGYTQRISRPGIVQLNPYVDRSNPQIISTGNPSLKAVLNNNVELSYNSYGKGNYNLAFSYAFSNNSIQQVTTLIDTVSYTSYQNVGKNKTAGLNASVSYPFTKALSATFNSEISYLWIKGTYNGQFLSNSGFQGFAYTTLNYKINPNWRATASLTFVSTNVTLQGSTNPYVFNSYRLYKTMFSKKLTVSAAVSNPFARYRYTRVKTEADDFRQLVVSQRLYRTYAVTLSYTFGHLASEIKKNQRSINNDDVAGKSSK